MATKRCPNCRERVGVDDKYCVECGANLTKNRYSRDDDPVDRINAVEEKLDRLLAAVEDEEDGEEEDGDEEEEEDNARKPKKASRGNRKPAAKAKRRTLFGR